MKVEANRIYLVARWYYGTNGQRSRFHTEGAFLNVENARQAAREANKKLLKYPSRDGEYSNHAHKHHVISYIIRDARHHCIFNITKD